MSKLQHFPANSFSTYLKDRQSRLGFGQLEGCLGVSCVAQLCKGQL